MPVSGVSAAEQPETLLNQHAIGGFYGIYYIPSYLEACQQDSLLENIRSSRSRWTQVIKQRTNSLQPVFMSLACLLACYLISCNLQVSGRKLQSYGGTVHEKWGGLLQAPLPSWLKPMLTKLEQDFQLFEGTPNHVLLNVYEPGQGILVMYKP